MQLGVCVCVYVCLYVCSLRDLVAVAARKLAGQEGLTDSDICLQICGQTAGRSPKNWAKIAYKNKKVFTVMLLIIVLYIYISVTHTHMADRDMT